LIIKGVESFGLDSDRLTEAKEIISAYPSNTQTKGLLLQIKEIEGGYGIYFWILSILSIIGIGLYMRQYRHPLVIKLSKNPKELLNLNIEQLNDTKERLKELIETLKEYNFEIDIAYLEQSLDRLGVIYSGSFFLLYKIS